MESQTQQQATPILEIAWTRFAQLDAISNKRTNTHIRTRRWIAIFGILATLLAILTTLFPASEFGVMGLVLQGSLILVPLIASGLAAFANTSGDWLVARAGAEEILKEIYMYRTVLKDAPKRRKWLEKRLVEIQRSVFRGMNGELTIPPYSGPLPPYYSPEDPHSDPGFDDLSGEHYFSYRLSQQLNWHVRKVNQRQAERKRLQALIIISGIASAFLAATVPIWVALAASLTAAFIGWQELRNLDAVIRNYSKVIMELNILNDHWINLEHKERSSTEFFEVVRSTEDILWSQNVEYIKAMQEALKESDLEEEASLINRVIKEARDSDRRLKQDMEDTLVNFTAEKLGESEEILSETFETAVRTLAEEASSDLVQAELAAMQQAIKEKYSDLKSTLESIAEEFAGVDFTRDTPPAVLNSLLSRFPTSQDPKG